MKKSFRRIVSWMMVLCMVLSLFPAVSAARITWRETDQKITAQFHERPVKQDQTAVHESSELVRVSIVLEGASAVEAGYATMGIGSNAEAMAYRTDLLSVQKRMEKTISAKALNGRPLDVVWNMTLVGNIISAWVPYGSIEEIAAIPGVKTVAMEAQYEPCAAERSEDVKPNTYASSGMTGVNTLWQSGLTGAGTRVAVVDTGTDRNHQSFDNGAYLHALAQNAAAKGMSEEEYLASLDLLTAAEIEKALPNMNLRQLDKDVTAEELYGTEKLPFGYNYVDANLNTTHMNDNQGEHGSHVGGISTANRFIPDGNGGYVSAADTVMTQGVAPDAQLITMKVFGEDSPYESDYMAAIEDAIMLNCDVVNLSLGTTAPGSPYTDVYSDLLEMMTETDTVVVISAGNASSWARMSLHGYSYSDDVVFDTVGSPGSFSSSFTVASVENAGTVGYYFETYGRKSFYAETLDYGNTALATLDTSADKSGTEYEYIFLDGLGYAEEYEGIDVTGKVVFVQRGTLNFADKANNALSRGAVAVAVYNNQPGVSNMNLTGLSYEAPVFSVTQADGAAIRALSEDQGTHLTGKMTVCGKQGIGYSDSEYYTMSDFSSWGVPGDLSLKPEITAPGGEIYSVWGTTPAGGGTDQYVAMSGTSMAAPQVAGMSALLAQYYQENGMAEASGISPRHLAQSLLMSTAEPLYEEASGGNYYSLLNQGSGLARVDLAVSADSFIKVAGQEDYKVKAELGDDPARTGVYTFDFTITNMTDSEKAYALDADLFRQDVFEYQENSNVWLLDTWTVGLDADVTFLSSAMTATAGFDHDLNGDGVTDAADADFLTEYVVGNVSELKAEGDISGDGQINSYDAHLLLAGLTGDTVTVPANDSVTVTVELALTDEAKAELDAETPNGTYVQAYVYARGVADAEGNVGTVHSIPVLAFYGDWSDPSMFDRGTLLDLVHLTSNVAPYLYQAVGPYGNALGINYGDGNEYYFGGNPMMQDDTYLPERNAFNSEDASVLTSQDFSLIRSAGDARVRIVNADSGEVYFERELGELLPAYFNTGIGDWDNAVQYAPLNWSGTDANGKPLAEGTQVAVEMTAVPYYYRQADGSYPFDGLGNGCTMTTTFTIDNTAPVVLDMDESQVQEGKLTITAQDNEYVAAVALLNSKGTKVLAGDTPNQTEKNAQVTVELDISLVTGQKFLVAVFDYANNMRTYEVTLDLPEIEREYFTGVNTNTGAYVTLDIEGNMTELSTLDIPTQVRAGEYVGGYVFTITSDNMLCVAKDADLTDTSLIGPIDPKNELLLDSVADMAYSYQDEQMYVLFYSALNDSWFPYLATLDLSDGSLNVLGEMPVDVQTLAIDGEGNCYSAGFDSPSLYTYTVGEAMSGTVTYVGEMSYFGTMNACCMAWDHNTDELYFSYPTTLLRVDPETAEPEILCYYTAQLLGLYIRPETEPTDKFDPTDEVDRIELNLTDTRVMLDSSLALEASIWPWNVSDKTLTWTSSDDSVATVDANGVVTARGLGQCVITATSNLDPTVSAQCTIETFQLEKTLNGLVWDTEGEIWMSEFSTAALPEYTKLSEKPLGKDLAAATIGQDGRLYAASLEMDDLTSALYELDATTFEPVKIGDGIPTSDDLNPTGYVDLAPAPGQGKDKLMGIWGGNVLNVNGSTGGYYNHYYMFSNNLVALAYVGTQEYKEWGYDTMVDWYFIIDRVGYVYLMGFLEQDGSYYYLEHDTLAPQGVYTVLDFEMETPYFGSAYFDGEMLYYSAYKESRDNVTLMAIDVAGGSKACYTLGTFENGVWPVAGLMELGQEVENHIGVIMGEAAAQTMAKPEPVEKQTELKGIREDKAEGTLNSAAAPMSVGEVKNDLVYVDVTLPHAGNSADMTVSYDTAKLELAGVSGNTTAFAWNAKDGRIELSLAEATVIPETRTVARLTFKPVGRGKTEVSVLTGGLSGEGCGYDEILTLDLPANNPFTDVAEGKFYYEPVLWAVEEGITTGTTDTTFSPDGELERVQAVVMLWRAAGEPEPVGTTEPFTDVDEDDWYYDAVLWAVENGITNGVTATEFDPYGTTTRSQVVAFLWRYLGQPGSTVRNSFTDVKPGRWYEAPINWAVENGITNGMGDGTFGIDLPCTRAHMVTFLYRALN